MAKRKEPSVLRAISPHTRNIVWARAAGRCQFRNCNVSLIGHLVAGNRTRNRGYHAHVIADSASGPRGDAVLSPARSNDPDNIMLLCDGCHREIDGEDTRRKYPPEVLYAMKRDHEAWIDAVLSAGPVSRSHILQFSAPIGENETAVPFDDCVDAMVPRRTPASDRAIEIKIKGMRHKDSDPDYWTSELWRLRQGFQNDLLGRFESGDVRHLSVFGLAPIPLLMELGRLLSDISVVDVYERHRFPEQQWRWPEDGPIVEFQRTAGPPGPKLVALKLAVTSEIADDRIINALGTDDVSIWQIASLHHGQGIVQHREDLARWRAVVARTLDEIKNQHGMDADVAVFPAIPVSCAVEFGRAWQPKAHPSLCIFDQVKDQGFTERVTFR